MIIYKTENTASISVKTNDLKHDITTCEVLIESLKFVKVLVEGNNQVPNVLEFSSLQDKVIGPDKVGVLYSQFNYFINNILVKDLDKLKIQEDSILYYMKDLINISRIITTAAIEGKAIIISIG